MKLTFLGTNGWYDNEIGNTVCALLESEKYYVIFDAGNGIYKLPGHIKSKKPDLSFFEPLAPRPYFRTAYSAKFKFKNEFNVLCPKGLKKQLVRAIDHPYAMPFREMKLRVKIKELSKDCREIPFPIECKKLFHIDPSFGYRITLDGKTVAYCSERDPQKIQFFSPETPTRLFTNARLFPNSSRESGVTPIPRKRPGWPKRPSARNFSSLIFPRADTRC